MRKKLTFLIVLRTFVNSKFSPELLPSQIWSSSFYVANITKGFSDGKNSIALLIPNSYTIMFCIAFPAKSYIWFKILQFDESKWLYKVPAFANSPLMQSWWGHFSLRPILAFRVVGGLASARIHSYDVRFRDSNIRKISTSCSLWSS